MSDAVPSSIRFRPIYQTRVWGGRSLETRLGRQLPDADQPYGESWELSAREEADSVVEQGPYAGMTLSQLWQDNDLRRSVFGGEAPEEERFPLLFKILDAREKLSIQVHPPAAVALELGGEPKTEVWYVAAAEPGASLYVGLKQGVTPQMFEQALQHGTVADWVHEIPVRMGDHLFIPSGRLHAIGAGLLIYEIQQNSDTTYRVFDWNRLGMDGQPRELHVEASLKCIDFTDIEPRLDQGEECLVCECEHFRVERHELPRRASLAALVEDRFAVVTILAGDVHDGKTVYREGDFFLIPQASGGNGLIAGEQGVALLLTLWGGAA